MLLAMGSLSTSDASKGYILVAFASCVPMPSAPESRSFVNTSEAISIFLADGSGPFTEICSLSSFAKPSTARSEYKLQ